MALFKTKLEHEECKTKGDFLFEDQRGFSAVHYRNNGQPATMRIV